MVRKSTINLGLGLSAVALGAAGLVGWSALANQHASDQAVRELRGANEELAGAIQGAAEAARLRATELAALRVVRAAVETDSATFTDLAHGNPHFMARPDETVEYFQTRDAGALPLLRVPSAGPALSAAKRVDAAGAAVQVIEVAPVSPIYPGFPGGTVAVARRIDASPLVVRLAVRGLDAHIGSEGSLAVESTRSQSVGIEAERVGYGLLGLALIGLAALVFSIRPRREPTERILAELAPPPTDRTQLLGGRYRLFRRLGGSGSAEVHLALSFQLPGEADEVALKIFRDVSPSVSEQFLHAAQALSRVSHPNLVQVLDFGALGGLCFVAMEYVDGWNLEALLGELRARQEPMPLEYVLTIGLDLCRGLDAAHRAVDEQGMPLKLVHGDVRPSNVLIARNCTVKLIDFAGVDPKTGKHPRDYTAPEQYHGRPLSERSDVYAVGAVLHELLTGSHARFRIVGPHVGRRGLFSRPRVSSLRPEVPTRLDAVIGRALAHAPGDRYGSCRELAADLERATDATSAPGGVGDWAGGLRHLSRLIITGRKQ